MRSFTIQPEQHRVFKTNPTSQKKLTMCWFVPSMKCMKVDRAKRSEDESLRLEISKTLKFLLILFTLQLFYCSIVEDELKHNWKILTCNTIVISPCTSIIYLKCTCIHKQTDYLSNNIWSTTLFIIQEDWKEECRLVFCIHYHSLGSFSRSYTDFKYF